MHSFTLTETILNEVNDVLIKFQNKICSKEIQSTVY